MDKDFDIMKRAFFEEKLILKETGEGYTIQRVGTSHKIKFNQLDRVISYLLGYKDGKYDERAIPF